MGRIQFFQNKARALYSGAWILLFIISIWLYLNEGRYLHLFVMDIATMGDEFEVSVWSGEKHAVVFPREDIAKIETEQLNLQSRGRELLQVTGRLPEENSGQQAKIVVLYDDDVMEGDFEIFSSKGVKRIEYSENNVANAGTFLYLYVPLVFGLSFVGMRALMGRKDRKRAGEILQRISQTEEGRTAINSGKLWMKRSSQSWERNRNLIGICITAGGLYMVHMLWHSDAIFNFHTGISRMIIYMGILVAGLYLLQIVFAIQNTKILTKENRPLTAAAAFLMEVSEGGQARARRRVLLHNAAAGLCHAGLYELAMETERLSYAKRESVFWRYLHGNIKVTCLSNCGNREETAIEMAALRELLQQSPRLAKRKDVQAASLSMKIAMAVMEGDHENACACLELYREQVKDDYYLIPVSLWEAELCAEKGDSDKARKLYDYLLQFSPENAAVRKAQEHGVCRYEEAKRLWKQEIYNVVVSGLLTITAGMFTVVLLVWCLAESTFLG